MQKKQQILSNSIGIFIALAITSPCAFSQQDWQIKSEINIAQGSYHNSQALDHQNSRGARLSFDHGGSGGTLGFQGTRIDLLSSLNQPQQTQENWLASVYTSYPTTNLAGQITFRVDSHHLHSSAQDQANAHIVAPQVSWSSLNLPLALEISTAHSNYPAMPTIKQYGIAARYGFNEQQDWLEIREYRIQDLDANQVFGRLSTLSHEIRLTHLFIPQSKWQPKRITVGMEKGEKVFFVDMQSQTVYNMRMLNNGGHSVTSNWQVNTKIDFTLQVNKNKYCQPNDFTLTTISAQTSITW